MTQRDPNPTVKTWTLGQDVSTNRLLLRQLSEERARDASSLLTSGQWSGAYYLTGYAVECALKACIARKTAQDDFPDKEFVIRSYTHKLEPLVDLAGLEISLKAKLTAVPAFKQNWLIVKNWDESARYKLWTEVEARVLYGAATEPNHGVLSWIMPHW